jgi:hypothetical protein
LVLRDRDAGGNVRLSGDRRFALAAASATAVAAADFRTGWQLIAPGRIRRRDGNNIKTAGTNRFIPDAILDTVSYLKRSIPNKENDRSSLI